MNNKKIIKLMILTLFLYGIYIIASHFQANTWSNILSPLVGIASFLIIFKNYKNIKVNDPISFKLVWLLYSFACLSWAIADFVWAVYYFIPTLDPEVSVLLIYLYTFPNIFLCIAVITAIYILMKKWNLLQLLLDSLAISISTVLLLWIIFFNSDKTMFQIITNDGLSSVLSISFDMIIIVSIFIWYISIRKGEIPIYIRMIALGSLLYSLVDLYYYYIYFNDHYFPNSIIDMIYLGSFVIITIGVTFNYSYRNSSSYNINLELAYNVGFTKKQLLLLICPILVFLYEGFVIRHLLMFLIIILIHGILGVYTKSYIDNEQLLIKEKEMNIELEEKIAQRTKELIDKNKELEGKNKDLDFFAKQDTVTSLYNRRYFIISLEKELETIESPSETLALLFIDIDRFKTINDMYGHHIGDKVLIEIAKRLKSFNHKGSFLARLGGDEFVMCYHGDSGYRYMEEISNTIIKRCCEAIEVEQYIFHVTISIGISIYPLDAIDRNTLMKNADIAMYQAKSLGKNQCVSFDAKFKDTLNRKSEIEFELKKLNLNQEFQLFYQPQYSIPDKILVGAEALIRWNNPSLGWVSPVDFIPIAEELNIINTIGEWVMEKAIKQIGKWNHFYGTNLKVGINVSPKQLDHISFIPNLKKMMDENTVPAEYIDIEITESIAIEGEDRIKQIDSLFSGLGVSISIDDFGTGYSSLSYLKFFPFDRIKIAKPLIDAISIDNYDLQIVKAVIMLAKSIGMKTIAEGVELQEQFDILVELGCDEIQGYFLGKPVPPEQFEELFLINYWFEFQKTYLSS